MNKENIKVDAIKHEALNATRKKSFTAFSALLKLNRQTIQSANCAPTRRLKYMYMYVCILFFLFGLHVAVQNLQSN